MTPEILANLQSLSKSGSFSSQDSTIARRKTSIDTGGLLQKIQDESDQMNMVDVEALSRKDSSCSTLSVKSLSYLPDSGLAGTIGNDPSRKVSSMSVDYSRKISTLSDNYYDYTAPETDAMP